MTAVLKSSMDPRAVKREEGPRRLVLLGATGSIGRSAAASISTAASIALRSPLIAGL